MEVKYRIKRKQLGEQPENIRFKRHYAVPETQTADSPPLEAVLEAAEQAEALAEDMDVQITKTDIKALKNLVRYYETSMDYLLMRNKPLRVVGINLLSGMAKGFGIAIGITLIAFVAFQILNKLEILNLPIIGDFIADLLAYIKTVQGLGNV